jgi:hypothetical protein
MGCTTVRQRLGVRLESHRQPLTMMMLCHNRGCVDASTVIKGREQSYVPYHAAQSVTDSCTTHRIFKHSLEASTMLPLPRLVVTKAGSVP